MYHTLLLDMDGTLVKSDQGILVALERAMTAMGVEPPNSSEVRDFIGPPLDVMLRVRYGFEGAKLRQAMDRYAQEYRTVGLRQTTAVPGMPELMARLKKAGYRLAVATCKPWEYCGPTLEACGFSGCFEAVAGSFHNGVPENKAAVIQEAMRLLDMKAEDSGEALMIGDRGLDVQGAREWGIPCLGVEFCGYADPGELAEAGAIGVVRTVEELEAFLTGHPEGNEVE